MPFLSTMNGKKILNDEYYGVRWIIIPVLVSMIWFSISKITGSLLFGIEPFYPGMITSLIYFISLNVRGKHGY